MTQQNNWQKEIVQLLRRHLCYSGLKIGDNEVVHKAIIEHVSSLLLQTHNEAIKAGIEGLPEEKPLQSNLAPTYSPFEQTFNQGQNAYRWQAIENLKKLLKEDE